MTSGTLKGALLAAAAAVALAARAGLGAGRHPPA